MKSYWVKRITLKARKMPKYKVQYVNKGIANRYPNHRIELHKKLKSPLYKPLQDEILRHEKGHTDKGYSFHDLKHDFAWIKHKRLYWQFILSTPSSWWQFSPLYKSKGKIYFDLTLTFFWIIIILCFILLAMVLRNFT